MSPRPGTLLAGQVAVVTGATSGIGKETAVELAARGATVVIAARSETKGRETLAEVRQRSGSDAVSVGALDLADLVSVRHFAERLLVDHDRLDVLVNNAGAIFPGRTETADGFESTFGVNHLGHFLLTTLLLDRLRASAPARVVTLSSFAHRLVRGLAWDDLQSERGYISMRAYARSKLANILFTAELSRRLASTGVTANAVHPGAVRSNFGSEYYGPDRSGARRRGGRRSGVAGGRRSYQRDARIGPVGRRRDGRLLGPQPPAQTLAAGP